MIDNLLLDWRIQCAAYRDFLIGHRAKGAELIGQCDSDIDVGRDVEDAQAARASVAEDLVGVDAELIVSEAAIAHVDHLLADRHSSI